MKTHTNRKQRIHRWVLFSNGALHGVQHTDLVFVKSVPHRSVTQSSVSVVTLSRSFGILAVVGILLLILLVAGGCQQLSTQKGGRTSSTITRPDHTNAVVLVQSDNPKEPSHQTVQSEQVLEYVLPPGSEFSLGSSPPSVLSASGASVGGPIQRQIVTVQRPVPVRMMSKDRTETSIGAAQRDTVREWAGKAANLHPVMWAGIVMMTLVAGALIYFGWYTKAAVAEAVGIAMIVLAQMLPDRGMVIFLGGIGTFAFISLIVLYSYYKGQWDQNKNGIPDFLEKSSAAAK